VPQIFNYLPPWDKSGGSLSSTGARKIVERGETPTNVNELSLSKTIRRKRCASDQHDEDGFNVEIVLLEFRNPVCFEPIEHRDDLNAIPEIWPEN
jgi:hypothetical protein